MRINTHCPIIVITLSFKFSYFFPWSEMWVFFISLSWINSSLFPSHESRNLSIWQLLSIENILKQNRLELCLIKLLPHDQPSPTRWAPSPTRTSNFNTGVIGFSPFKSLRSILLARCIWRFFQKSSKLTDWWIFNFVRWIKKSLSIDSWKITVALFTLSESSRKIWKEKF